MRKLLSGRVLGCNALLECAFKMPHYENCVSSFVCESNSTLTQRLNFAPVPEIEEVVEAVFARAMRHLASNETGDVHKGPRLLYKLAVLLGTMLRILETVYNLTLVTMRVSMKHRNVAEEVFNKGDQMGKVFLETSEEVANIDAKYIV